MWTSNILFALLFTYKGKITKNTEEPQQQCVNPLLRPTHYQ